jgi:5-methylcytosine-specific restriction endonuclease McrA
MSVRPGKEFTSLARSYGIPAGENGVSFDVIKRRVAVAICLEMKASIDSVNVDSVLRTKLGRTESAFESQWIKAGNPQSKRRNAKLRAPAATRHPPVKSASKLGAPHPDYVRNDGFYESREWRQVRYAALKACGAKCLCCGASAADGARLHVDHIKPRYTHTHLSLELSNLQVLCEDCNVGKGAWDDTDWRHFRSI